MEQTTGKILFAKNEREPLPPASITKVMSLLLVMEALDRGSLTLETEVCCSAEAVAMGGSQIWLEAGEVMTVDELLQAAAIASANDATLALAEAVAGSEGAFVELMNRRAEQLGMTDTTYKNAVGLDEEGHLSSARDVAIVSAELLKHPLITNYSTVWMSQLRGGETQLVNTNRLIRSYEGATGLKTGTTSQAGKCLAATATREGLSLVAVVLGCQSSDDRFAAGRALLDYGFANYTCWTPQPPEEGLTSVEVTRGTRRRVQSVCQPQNGFVVEKNLVESITQRVELQERLEAPVQQGQIIGRVVVEAGGKQLGEYPVTAADSVERMTWSRALALLWQQLCDMN
jgi:D-alanyl-D-alanine carboxypeptidase (penicillin-binding protein 5/6)